MAGDVEYGIFVWPTGVRGIFCEQSVCSVERMLHLRLVLVVLSYLPACLSFHPNMIVPSSILSFNHPDDQVFRIAKMKLMGSKHSDDQKKKKRVPTKIEDGSPLGVAIVVLGSLYVIGSENFDTESPAGDSPAVWVIFATASIAAGISRLIRNWKGK